MLSQDLRVPSAVNRWVELTYLKSDCWAGIIEDLCEQAVRTSCAGVCVRPEWVNYARACLAKRGRPDIKVVQVLFFPGVSSKVLAGDEVDIYLYFPGCLDSRDARESARWSVSIILKALEAKGFRRSRVKIIVEARQLSDKELSFVTKLLAKLKVGYIKTSTGVLDRTNSRTNLEDLRIIVKSMPWFGYRPKIKVSGGIRTAQEGWKLIANGANILGTSSVLSY